MIAIAVLVPFYFLGRRYYGELDRLAQAPLHLVVAMAVAYLLTRAMNGEIMCRCLSALGYTIGFVESWVVGLLT